MEKPLKEHYQMSTDYGDTLAIYDYIEDMEKYCTFLETENKALALLSVVKSVKEREEIVFEEWVITHKFKMTEHGYSKNGVQYMVSEILEMYLSDVYQL